MYVGQTCTMPEVNPPLCGLGQPCLACLKCLLVAGYPWASSLLLGGSLGWGKWGIEEVADAVGSDPKSPGAGPQGEQRELTRRV